MIKVFINKKEMEIEENLTVSELLLNLKTQKATVWVNGKQLLKAEYDTYTIRQGDNIKTLRLIAGG